MIEKGKKLVKCVGWLKRILTIKNNYEDGMKLERRIFGRTGKDLRGTLLWSSKTMNDDEKHHYEL